ncbi:hypothetical protein AWC38_SpisGene4519 [Stylophora pistillata]|uniref:Uncharacterized protein n=1 Tax=Stylophora pistillata TaxID=50429 RepID=A0A2B4SL52_STYPI|nr:hypothetical protein AWC38_SpisGene4519 [Stylophora pistillata]
MHAASGSFRDSPNTGFVWEYWRVLSWRLAVCEEIIGKKASYLVQFAKDFCIIVFTVLLTECILIIKYYRLSHDMVTYDVNHITGGDVDNQKLLLLLSSVLPYYKTLKLYRSYHGLESVDGDISYNGEVPCWVGVQFGNEFDFGPGWKRDSATACANYCGPKTPYSVDMNGLHQGKHHGISESNYARLSNSYPGWKCCTKEMLSEPIVGIIDRMDGCDVSCGMLLFKRLSVVPDVIGK